MGLFDTVEIHEEVLNVQTDDDRMWQTKSIDIPRMNSFVIDENGTLWEEEYHNEKVPKEERPKYNEEIEGFDSPGHEFFGSMKRVHDGWIERSGYHGRFQVSGPVDGEYTRYELTYNHGELEDIEEVELE